VAEEEGRHGTALVASGDRDAFQLASAATTILHPVKAGEMARIGPAGVLDRYGVEPRQVPDFIALRGDPSDRLPGARGVGAKGAATLLQRYGTLERIIAEGRLTEQADALKLYKRLATMTRRRRSRHSAIRRLTGRGRRHLPGSGNSLSLPADLTSVRCRSATRPRQPDRHRSTRLPGRCRPGPSRKGWAAADHEDRDVQRE
jgi:5'-3' exonuclease